MTQKAQENGAGDPLVRLRSEATGLLEAIGNKVVTSLKGAVEDATDRLTEYTSGGATPGVKAAAAAAAWSWPATSLCRSQAWTWSPSRCGH